LGIGGWDLLLFAFKGKKGLNNPGCPRVISSECPPKWVVASFGDRWDPLFSGSLNPHFLRGWEIPRGFFFVRLKYYHPRGGVFSGGEGGTHTNVGGGIYIV